MLTATGSRATSNAERLLALLADADATATDFTWISGELLDLIPEGTNRTAAKKLVDDITNLPRSYLADVTLPGPRVQPLVRLKPALGVPA